MGCGRWQDFQKQSKWEEWSNIFKILRQKKNFRIICSLKISFRNKGKLTKFQLCSSWNNSPPNVLYYPRTIRLIQHFKIKVIHYIKRLSKKNHIIISIDTEKYLTEFTIHSLLKQNKQTKNTFQPTAIFPSLINSFSISSLLLCNSPQTYIPNNYCRTVSGG